MSWDGSRKKRRLRASLRGQSARAAGELAAELVRLNVDVIVALGTLAPLAAKRVTSTIPIVMTALAIRWGAGSLPAGAARW